MNTFKIYQELSKSLGDDAARSLAELLGGMYEELANSVTKEDFRELKAVVVDLTEAQKRTEARVGELAEAQKRTEARVEELAEAQKRTEARVEELAEAQKRTEARVGELAEAQKRTEERVDTLSLRMEELAAAQVKTEEAIRHLSRRIDDTNRQLGGLSATVGYTLENEAYLHLPALLQRDFGIQIEEPLRRGFLNDTKGRPIEVNILGRAKRDGEEILIVGESKAQLSRKKIADYIGKTVPRIDTGGLTPFVVIIAHMESEPGVKESAREKGAAVYFSYEFRQPAA